MAYTEKHLEGDSLSTVDNFDTPEDRKLVWKVDLRLIPILTILYLLSFLDRSNIGNAKLDGLVTDLYLPAANYNTALALYFVGYVIFEVPSNVNAFASDILKRFDPQLWLPSLTLLWGIASIGQGLIKNQAGLYGIRFLIGATEAGLFPGVIFLFSMYYRRHERPARVAIFFGGAALAGAFGGILAYAIGNIKEAGGHKGWQWIFIIEGLVTVAVSLVSYFIVPTWAHSAKFLKEPERERLLARLQADSDSAYKEKFEWFFVWQAVTDHFVWGYALLFHGFSFALYSLSLFMPTIIADMGFATWKAQLMTVPPYALAALSIWLVVFITSRIKMRGILIIIGAAVAIIGYIVLLTTKTAGAQYVGVLLAAAGIYSGNSLLLSWVSENVGGQTKRAVAVAMQITIGDIGAISGSLIYRPNFAGHNYRKPHIIAIGYLTFAIAVATYLWLSLARANRQRDIIKSGGEEDPASAVDHETALRLGDRDVNYRYQL